MFTLILSAVSRQTRTLCKKTATNNNQMSGLSDLLPNSWRRHVWRPSHIFSSQSIGGSPSSERWQRRGTEMQQLRWKQHRNLLLFCVPELSMCSLFWSSSTPEGHKRSPKYLGREFASARCSRIDQKTCDVFTAIPRRSNTWILLRRMQGLYLPQVQCGES